MTNYIISAGSVNITWDSDSDRVYFQEHASGSWSFCSGSWNNSISQLLRLPLWRNSVCLNLDGAMNMDGGSEQMSRQEGVTACAALIKVGIKQWLSSRRYTLPPPAARMPCHVFLCQRLILHYFHWESFSWFLCVQCADIIVLVNGWLCLWSLRLGWVALIGWVRDQAIRRWPCSWVAQQKGINQQSPIQISPMQ